MPRWIKSAVERFEDKYIVDPNGCWLWQASKDANSYGTFLYEGVTQRAHRASWKMFRGTIPDGLLVCHTCDTPSCVNPHHLFLGTHADNNRDCWSKDRRKGLSGSKNGRALLSKEDVRHIRQRALNESKAKISRDYPVSRQQISDIVAGKKWTHV